MRPYGFFSTVVPEPPTQHYGLIRHNRKIPPPPIPEWGVMARKRIHAHHIAESAWTVRDELLGYRICNCYQDAKFPHHASHIHDQKDRVVAPCSIRSPASAYAIMTIYHQHHTAFDLIRLQQEIEQHEHPHHP